MHPPVTNGHSVDRVADLRVQIEATSTRRLCQKRWIDLAKFGEPRSRSTSPQTTARVTKRRRRVGGEITVCGHSAREKVRTFPPLVGGNRNVLKILQ
jgi:hypothetical protein